MSLKYAPELAEMSSFERDFVLSAQLGQDKRHCLPYEAATLRSEVWPTRPFISLKDVSKVRDKMLALGILLRRSNARKVWLEIAPEFRHSEGQNETSFGDERPEEEQGELPLAPAKPKRSAKSGNRVRREEKDNENTESAPPEVSKASSEAARPRTQDLDLGREGKFARSVEDHPEDDLWRSLCKALGLSEMFRNGALWEKRMGDCRDALATALSDWKGMTPESRAKYSAAAYLTTAYENEKRKFL